MNLRVLKWFLPLGLFIQVIRIIGDRLGLLSDFFSGFFTGSSIVFMLAGIFVIALSRR